MYSRSTYFGNSDHMMQVIQHTIVEGKFVVKKHTPKVRPKSKQSSQYLSFLCNLSPLNSIDQLQLSKNQYAKMNLYLLNFITSYFKLQNKMQETQSKPIQQKAPYRPTKFFLSSLNTRLGHALVRRLRNQNVHPQNPNRVIGTLVAQKHKLQQQFNSTPEGVRKVIETEKVQFFHDVLLNSDVIIYDLNTCNLDEAQSAISALKISQYTENKTLICISNVMTWAKSKPKEKKQGEQEEQDENPVEEPDSEQEGGEPPADQGEQKKTYVRFTQKDYNLRRPHPSYEKIKSMQTLCLAAGTSKPNLKTYVICSGIIYGSGEQLLQPYFMQARLQKPEALSVYGKGKNRIPMVHLQDLVSYIEKTVDKKPKIPYILALDQNPKPTQKKIIESISKGVGTGKIVHVPVSSDVPNIDILTLNLRMKPCMYFAKLQEEQAAIEVEEGVEIQRFKFQWQSKQGVQKNIEKLRQQFNKALGLKQQKVFIMGPPGCGKTHFAKKLSQKYYLPHLNIKDVIEEVKNLQNEFGQQVRNAYNEKKESQIATKQEEYEAEKEKWKKIPKQLRQPLAPFNPDKVDVRLPDDLIYKCYKWRLSQNDCLNRGYILDGYPRKYQDAKQIFMGYPPMPEGEEPDENTKKVLDQRLAPTKFILLEQSDEEILENLQKLPEEKIEGTHFTQKLAKRRLKQYRTLMNSETGDEILPDFFSENKIQTHNINVSRQTQSHLESIVKPISISEQQEYAKIRAVIQKEKEKKQKARQEMTKKQDIIRNIQAEDYRMKKENEQNQEREILDKKSLALRKYLDVNLVPILADGIFEILKEFPKDPVDRLAQFLFKNSLKVPNPDPSTFQF